MKKDNIKTLIGMAVLFLAAIGTTLFLYLMKWEPSGLDVWGHVFKANVMYEGLQEGVFYPLYTPKWYNGIQLYRYWPPFCYYIMAFLQFLAGGDPIVGYYLFAFVTIFVGGVPFVLLGKHMGRPIVGVACALLYFCLPDNIRVYFVEGNMPRIATSIIIPYVIYFLWKYIREHKKTALIGLMLSMMCMTFTHLMLTAITGIGTFIFLCFDWFQNRDFKRDFIALVSMVIGILMAGIWFIPALHGGMLAMGDSSSDTQDLLTFSLAESLNGLNRVFFDVEIYYFGLSVIFVAVFGLILSKNQKAGFVFAIFVLLGTTPATVSITKHLPLGEFLWMTRFTALAYAFFLLSILEWKRIRKKYAILLFALLALDSSVGILNLNRYYSPALEEAKVDGALLNSYTTQRANVMDHSLYGCYLSWSLVEEGDADYTFGWAWQGAETAENIMLMNEALEHEAYTYIFDRSIEHGDDTVLVQAAQVFNEKKMLDAAKLLGYQLVEESDTGYVFKLDTPKQFGVKTEYLGIAIGSYAKSVCIYYPTFSIGASNVIEDYTIEELSKYQTVFLSGFSYRNQKDAESFLNELADKGVRVVIDCAHLPENGLQQKQFLGTIQNSITFENVLPNLKLEDNEIVAGRIPIEDGIWQTGYVNNQDKVLGYVDIGSKDIPYLSYNEDHENIWFLGLNLAYYAVSADNTDVMQILDQCFGVNYNQCPKREIVPLNIEVTWDSITIDCEETGVNTTLAFQDNFKTEQKIWEENNLMYIGDNHTEIDIVYPYFWQGFLVSLLGLASAGLLFCTKFKKYI